MKTPLTYGAHRIIHDLFSKGAMFKGALSREKLPELEERGFVATNANNLVYLTPTGQQYAIESFIGEHSKVSQGLCGNTIEQETLSSVLAHYLPNTSLDKARDHAVMLASAVKASFAELKHSTGGFVISRDGAAQVIGEKFSETIIPALKPSTDGKEKRGSTFTINIEVDASKAIQALDEFSHAFDKRIASALEKGLMPGGKLREAISQKADVSGHQSLSHRVSDVESALASLSSQIMVLQTKHASPV
ncbi:TPA: hypothetical protein MYK53_004874 [Klebsiella pneumoniae]|nr:hypothetical protein [Klebsiella pneumoniae]HCA9718850.1 hypothetical protein [Klebsiella pneumoniae]